MEKDTPIQNNSPPGSAPKTGKTKQVIPGISVIGIQPKIIPKITITDSKEGITIEYAKSPSTHEAVDRILQFIENRSNRHFTYPAPKPHTSIIIFLAGVHPAEEQSKAIVFENKTLKRANELVIQYIDKLNLNDLKTISVKEVEVPVEKPVLPLLGLHEELEKAGAYAKLREMRTRKSSEDDDPEKRARVLEAYLTTNKPMGDLMDIAGVKTADAVNHIVHRNLDKIFSELPPDVQQKYGGSAKEAIKRKASKQLQTATSRERVKKGVEGRVYTKPTGRPKGVVETRPRQYKGRRGRPEGIVETQPRQYKEKTGRPKGRKDSQPRNASRENLSKAARRRWELYRERQAQSTPAQETAETPTQEEHTVVDFTKQSQ